MFRLSFFVLILFLGSYKVTNMAQNKLIFTLLVSGTQLIRKNIEESHMIPK